jgi:outer membrane protein assembly factor BamA
VQATVERPIGPWSLQWVASHRLVNTEAAESEREAEIPLESRDARVASFTQGLTYDRRNDLLDPTRGWFANAQLEYAAPLASADAHFLKFFAQTSRYQPIGRRMVLAGSVRVGAIEPLATPDDPADDPLGVSAPAAELFYAGGRTSHRAYERDTLGVLGETLLPPEDGLDAFPTGGGGLLLANLELRFPVAGPIGGTLFVDGGNVWREYREIDTSQLKWGVGAGVRYLSPIGPLRAEIGWKLDPEPFEDPYVWFISLGNAF